ncbi:MAG: alpha/beta fold hydrolase, partial [Candidatus Kariarchaeaceae archaeon]
MININIIIFKGATVTTKFFLTPDDLKIAYDVEGEGPALILLHGGGQNRMSWHEMGYVTALKSSFKIITIDIRGNGESDKPDDPLSYEITKICQDIIGVADQSHVD